MGTTRVHGLTLAAWAAVALSLCAGSLPASELIPVYGAVVRGPSVTLPYRGGSPYSGIGRYDGLTRCTAFFLDTRSFPDPENPGAGNDDAPAYAVTEGRCAANLESEAVVVDARAAG